MLGNPEIDDAPVGPGESLGDPPKTYVVVVDRAGLGRADRGSPGVGKRSDRGVPSGLPQVHGRLQQSVGVGRQSGLGVQDSDPGSVAAACVPGGLLIGEPGESTQMTPVCTGRISVVLAG